MMFEGYEMFLGLFPIQSIPVNPEIPKILIPAICVIFGKYRGYPGLFVVGDSFYYHPLLFRKLFQPIPILFIHLQAHPTFCRIGFRNRKHSDLNFVFHAPSFCPNYLTDVLKQEDFTIFRHHGSLWPDSSAPPACGREIGKNGNPH